MPDTSHAHDSAITLTLSEDQLHALGLGKLPAPGAELHIRATATVAHPHDAAHPADTDHDAAIDAHGGDRDGDETNEADQENRAEEEGPDRNQADQDDAAEQHAPALTLRLSGLSLIPVHRSPDKVLYGSGD